MNDWKAPVGGGGRGGGSRNYRGPNNTSEKVDYSQLPLGGGSDDEGGGDDWIQRQIRGHKVGDTDEKPLFVCEGKQFWGRSVTCDVVKSLSSGVCGESLQNIRQPEPQSLRLSPHQTGPWDCSISYIRMAVMSRSRGSSGMRNY